MEDCQKGRKLYKERFDLTQKLKLLAIFIYADVYGQDVIDHCSIII
jgi:hypothetical protein